MTTTLSGLATIRAFRAQKLFREQYYRYQNDHTATYFLCFTASRALGMKLTDHFLNYNNQFSNELIINLIQIFRCNNGLALHRLHIFCCIIFNDISRRFQTFLLFNLFVKQSIYNECF